MKKHPKVGRNDKCPCGSNIKYKFCHNKLPQTNCSPPTQLNAYFSQKTNRAEILEWQRECQQGLGKPIISWMEGSTRIINVGNKIYPGEWKTFHDFLFIFPGLILGTKWGNDELRKPYEERHPLLKLYDLFYHQKKKFTKELYAINTMPPTGACRSYMWAAYNLYLIAHNAHLEERLIKRFKNKDQFAGANYEIYIAATFIRAGFSLEFEDEDDRTTSHCEFIATDKASGKKYSVEVKLRHRKNLISPKGSENYRIDIISLLNSALNKEAKHERIIFIDLNLPDPKTSSLSAEYLTRIIKMREKNPINGKSDPSAYIFITNHSSHYHLDTTDGYPIFFTDGFNIPDYGNIQMSFHNHIEARKKHAPMYKLWKSLEAYTFIIPLTFDGSMPDFIAQGIEDREMKNNRNPFYLFDSLMEEYKHLTKEDILNQLKVHPNYSQLEKMQNEEILQFYCEALVVKAFKTGMVDSSA